MTHLHKTSPNSDFGTSSSRRLDRRAIACSAYRVSRTEFPIVQFGKLPSFHAVYWILPSFSRWKTNAFAGPTLAERPSPHCSGGFTEFLPGFLLSEPKNKTRYTKFAKVEEKTWSIATFQQEFER